MKAGDRYLEANSPRGAPRIEHVCEIDATRSGGERMGNANLGLLSEEKARVLRIVSGEPE